MTKIIQQTTTEIRKVPFLTLVKGTVALLLAPAVLLFAYFMYDVLSFAHVMYGAVFLFIMAIILVYPYIANLSALTHYVRKLATDEKAAPPDLSFLNNVEELSAGVAELHDSWEQRRRRLEAIITENEVLINSLPEVLLMLDSEGNLVRSNSKAQEVFGARQVEQTLRELVRKPEIKPACEATLTDGNGRNVALYLPFPIDRHFIVNIERFPLFRWGKIALIVVLYDITDQKLTEQMLSDFVANASHEIRTPLTSLMGFIETLQTSIKDDPEHSEKFLAVMAAQAERMSQLVSGLLSLSKIQRNFHTLPTEEVEMAALMQKVVAHFSMQLQERGIQVQIDDTAAHTAVRGDVNELTQVLENILQNAIKYGNAESTIVLRMREEPNHGDRMPLMESKSLLVIEVEDEGEGIAAEHLPRLTERFYRVDSARSRKVGGTGLGLAIVKHILNRHRGALEIESTVGKGSIFRVILPILQA